MKAKFAVFFLLLVLGAWSIESSSGRNESGRVWIFFKDRPYTQTQSIHSAQLTNFKEAAIHRREVRGSGKWEDSDFALDPSYIKEVKNAGARIRVESRWLNAV